MYWQTIQRKLIFIIAAFPLCCTACSPDPEHIDRSNETRGQSAWHRLWSVKLILFIKHIVAVLLVLTSQINWAANWQTISPGIDYQDLNAGLLHPWSHIHVFRIDLSKNSFDLVLAKQLSQKNASVKEFAYYANALIALNGGFFDRQYRPLGLRISNNGQENPLKRISWWGVFYIKNQIPHIVSMRNFRQNKQITFALQSGPRLIVNGSVPSLKDGIAERSALGITPNQEVIILVTENAPMTTSALAELLKSEPLLCQDALNLDGGSSTQLTTRIHNFKINVHGYANISDAVVIRPIESN